MPKLTEAAKHIFGVYSFAHACEKLTSDEIYELYEDYIQPALRDEITNTFWSNSKEPVRAALHQLGERYCIESLINY